MNLLGIEFPSGMGIAVIGIILAVIFAFMLITAADMAKKYYRCLKCGERFRAKANNFLLFSYFDETEHILRCPKCGKKGICTVSYDQSEK